ncbi:MAG: formylglycine-generating enzyme family protein [Planctomycetota bacterium]
MRRFLTIVACLLTLGFASWRITAVLLADTGEPARHGNAKASSAAVTPLSPDERRALVRRIRDITQALRNQEGDRDALREELRDLTSRLRGGVDDSRLRLPQFGDVPALAEVEARIEVLKQAFQTRPEDREEIRREQFMLHLARMRYIFDAESFGDKEIVSVEDVKPLESLTPADLLRMERRGREIREMLKNGQGDPIKLRAEAQWLRQSVTMSQRRARGQPWWSLLASRDLGKIDADDPSTQPSIAVVSAGSDDALNSVALLTEALLSSRGKLRVIDRESFGSALDEMRLVLAAAPSARSIAGRLALIDADLILAVRPSVQGDATPRAALIHAATGVVTGLFDLPESIDDGEAIESVCDEIESMAVVNPEVVRLCAVPPVIDTRLYADNDGLARRLREAVEAALIERGIAILSFDDAEALRREMLIRSQKSLPVDTVPWYLQLSLAADPATPDDITLRSSLQRLDVVQWVDESRVGRPADEARRLADRMTVGATAIEDAKAIDDRGGRLMVLANEARSNGQWREALSLVETAVLYRPNHFDARVLGIELLSEGIERVIALPGVPDQSLIESLNQMLIARGRHFDRVLDLLVIAIVLDQNRLRLGDGFRASSSAFLESRSGAMSIDLHGLERRGATKTQIQAVHAQNDLVNRENFRRQIERLYDATRQVRDDHQLNYHDPFRRKFYGHNDRYQDHLLDLQVAMLAPRSRVLGRIRDTWYAFGDTEQRAAIIRAIDRRIAAGVDPIDVVLAMERARHLMNKPSSSRPRYDWSLPSTLPEGTPKLGVVPMQPMQAPMAQPDAIDRMVPLAWRSVASPAPPAIDRPGSREWTDAIDGGVHGDVLVRRFDLLLLRPDGSVEQLFELKPADVDPESGGRTYFHQAAFDGRHVWALLPQKNSLLLRIDPATKEVRRFGLEDGLLPSAGGGSVVALGPGRVVVTAATEAELALTRNWSFLLEVGGNGPARLTTLYRAATSHTEDEDGKRAVQLSRSKAIVDPGPARREAVLTPLSRSKWLCIDVQERRAKVIEDASLHEWHDAIVTGSGVSLTGRMMVRLDPFTGDRRLVRVGMLPGDSGSNAVQRNGWFLRVADESLYTARSLDEPMLRIAPIRGGLEVGTLVASRHHGLLNYERETLTRLALPGDLASRHASATYQPPQYTYDSWQNTHYIYMLRPWFVMTIDEARRMAGLLGKPLPKEKIELYGNRFNSYWLDLSASKLGKIEEQDLLPAGQGPYAIEYVFPINNQPHGFYGRESTHESYLRYDPADRPPLRPKPKTYRYVVDPAELAPPVVPLPAGKMRLGSPPGSHPLARVQPLYDVEIPEGLFIAATELTELQYERVVNPERVARLSAEEKRAMAWTAKELTLNDATHFATRLTVLTGQYWRMPSSQEWEYACRAGSTTAYANGDSVADLRRIATYNATSEPPRVWLKQRIRRHAPNAWGLYDAHGGLAEWTLLTTNDFYRMPKQPPPGFERGFGYHFAHGGAWFDNADRCRSSDRRPDPEFGVSFGLGLRVLLDTRPEAKEIIGEINHRREERGLSPIGQPETAY